MLLLDMLVFCVSSAFGIKKCEYWNRRRIHIDLSRNYVFRLFPLHVVLENCLLLTVCEIIYMLYKVTVVSLPTRR